MTDQSVGDELLTPAERVADLQAKGWTAEEAQLVQASRDYFYAIAACEQAGGNTQGALMEAMPPEMRGEGSIIAAIAGI